MFFYDPAFISYEALQLSHRRALAAQLGIPQPTLEDSLEKLGWRAASRFLKPSSRFSLKAAKLEGRRGRCFGCERAMVVAACSTPPRTTPSSWPRSGFPWKIGARGTTVPTPRWAREDNGGTRVFDAMDNIATVDFMPCFLVKNHFSSTRAMLYMASNTRVPPLPSRIQRSAISSVPTCTSTR